MEKKLRKVQRKQQQFPNTLFYSFMFQVVLSVTVQRNLLRATGSVIKAPLNVHYNSVPGNSLCTESCHMFQLLQLVNGPQWQLLTCPPTILTSCIFDKLSSSADRLKTARGLCTNLRLWNLHMLLFSNLIKHTTEPVFVEHISLVVWGKRTKHNYSSTLFQSKFKLVYFIWWFYSVTSSSTLSIHWSPNGVINFWIGLGTFAYFLFHLKPCCIRQEKLETQLFSDIRIVSLVGNSFQTCKHMMTS